MPEIRRMSDSEEEVSSGHVSRNSLNASPNRELETSKHPLQNKWTLWYFKNDRAKDWESNQKQVNRPSIFKSRMYAFRKIYFTGHHFFHRGRLLGFIQSHRKCLQIGQRLRLLPFQRGHQTHVGGWEVCRPVKGSVLIFISPETRKGVGGWSILTRNSERRV